MVPIIITNSPTKVLIFNDGPPEEVAAHRDWIRGCLGDYADEVQIVTAKHSPKQLNERKYHEPSSRKSR